MVVVVGSGRSCPAPGFGGGGWWSDSCSLSPSLHSRPREKNTLLSPLPPPPALPFCSCSALHHTQTPAPPPTSTMSTPGTNEAALVPPNPTPTVGHSRRGSIPSKPAAAAPTYEDALRKDMGLVAEAAKRASVAIVVRDLKECRV